MYLVPGGVVQGGCTWSWGGVPGPGGYLVPGGWGTWSGGVVRGVPGPGGYLVLGGCGLGGVPGPGGVPSPEGGVPGPGGCLVRYSPL